jgi:hypothetical protein
MTALNDRHQFPPVVWVLNGMLHLQIGYRHHNTEQKKRGVNEPQATDHWTLVGVWVGRLKFEVQPIHSE